MSQSTRRAFVYALLLCACATGGKSGGGDDDPGQIDAAVTTRYDANTSVTVDAPGIKLDGGVPLVDAFVPPQPDAASGPFCSQNSQCTKAGECCITLSGPMGFCGPGTVILGQCVPQ